MNKDAADRFERRSERIPTAEEVRGILRRMIGKEYAETKKLEDDKGLYRLDVKVPGEKENEIVEYEYVRKAHNEVVGSTAIEIFVTYYKDGEPISGTSAARYVNGKWEIL
jgi:hypothetical protein